MARLALQGALAEDVPVVLGTLMVTTVVVLLGSLVINGLQILLNPAARRGKDAVAGGR
jgi:peptide/nickel transport system permease protein